MTAHKGILIFLFLLVVTSTSLWGQAKSVWVDSIMSEMTMEEKIGQLFMIRAFSKDDPKRIAFVKRQIKDYHVGGVCFFQGDPVRQTNLAKEYQNLAKYPLIVSMDAEWGLGMRFPKTTLSYPKQMTIGAINDHQLIYRMGKEMGRQLQLAGVNMNFAPVLDVNNNPQNPVINYRSFGEDRFSVASKGYAYMKGLQDADVMACLKHFPGHGDTGTDSHFDLPVITHDRDRLDSVELFPFTMLMERGAPAVMVAHLQVPVLDDRKNRPTSLSKNVVTDLLRDEIGFKGLAITDGMEMEAVTKYYAPGLADVEAILAGNDIVCVPEDIDAAIKAVSDAVTDGTISVSRLDQSVKRILEAKYDMNLHQIRTIASPSRVMQAANSAESKIIKSKIFEKAITLVSNKDEIFPINDLKKYNYGSISLGSNTLNQFQQKLLYYVDIDHTFLEKGSSELDVKMKVNQLSKKDLVFITLEDMSKYASKNYGVDPTHVDLINQLAEKTKVVLVVFGTPYSLQYFENLDNIIVAYEDDPMAMDAAAQAVMGAIEITGKLPVSASSVHPVGTGSKVPSLNRLGFALPEAVGLRSDTLRKIDSLVDDLIKQKAAPGCQVLVAKDNKIVYHKAYGHHTYQKNLPVGLWDVYDLASVTKVLASTVSAMHLEDQGKFDARAPIRQYIPEEDTTNKANLVYEDLLAHHAGLAAWIPFYRYTVEGERKKKPSPEYYRPMETDSFNVMVTPGLYLREDYPDTIWRKIFSSKLRETNNYRYSDLAFYIMNRTIKNITGYEVDGYADINFYQPLGLRKTMFSPYRIVNQDDIVPSELDQYWRNQVVDGTVHDMGAAMLGGVSGHAGLFSNAYEVGVLMQMVLNGGNYGGRQYIKPETIEYYTQRHWRSSRRGIGWDMKELNPDKKLNMSEKASRKTFGHLGFTGTATFADPDHDLVFVFLSNRTYPSMNNNKLGKEDYRPRIQSVIYDALMLPDEMME